MTLTQTFKKQFREATWALAVLVILLDATTTQLAMSFAGAEEANPLWATAFNEYHLLWPVAIASMLLVTVLANYLLTYPLDKRMDFVAWLLWFTLWLFPLFRIPLILNNWYIFING